MFSVAADSEDLRCHNCLAIIEPKILGDGSCSCKGCQFAHYCSMSWMEMDFRDLHKQECGFLRRMVVVKYKPGDHFLMLLKGLMGITISPTRSSFDGRAQQKCNGCGFSPYDTTRLTEATALVKSFADSKARVKE
ncbi:hypothetical protein BV898_07004 [Hypsibius exemplaris]|uniref:MYND-type domain-containing protein n=1 Tax=Hypsibius exemplaris TaxID=2072580 RepID=A0A1W0WUS2_HYPEX|nr:hypothetical protein BV898_07004 [Hypsibius exemplaris]